MELHYKDKILGGTFNNGEIIQWEDINGRPDLSNVSKLDVVQVTILSVLWDENNEVTIPVEKVLADASAQLIAPAPTPDSYNVYYESDIQCISQAEGSLIFKAETVPEEDVEVYIYIQSVTEVSEEYVGEFVWWSPEMTSDNTPNPYVVTASKWESIGNIGGQPYMLFDNNPNTGWIAINENTDLPPLWVAFDFGKSQAIKGISVRGINLYSGFQPSTFDLEGSNNGSTWSVIQHFENVPQSLAETKLELDKAVKYRHYRLNNCDALADPNRPHAIMSEVRFYKMEDPQ